MLFVISAMLVFSTAVYAAPSLQINSPQNTTYGTTRVVLNVTANETVDFYLKGSINNFYVKKGSQNYVSAVYGKKGSYRFTIYANNSNGVATASVNYSINHSNPVFITSGGILTSGNTEYIVANDITDDGISWFLPVENITLNLNGFTVGFGFGINSECARSKVFNGTFDVIAAGIFLELGSSCLFENITIISDKIGILVQNTEDVTFDNIRVTASVGFYSLGSSAVLTVRDSTITSSGVAPDNFAIDKDVAFFHETSGPDKYTLEHVNITNFTLDFAWVDAILPEYVLRSTQLRINDTDLALLGAARFYKQHLIIVNTSDNNGVGTPAVVEIKENSPLKKDFEFDITANPTSSLLVATNESGLAEVWLTERVSVLRIESPLTIEEVVFSPYNITAHSRDVNQTQVLDIIGNSTFNLNVNFTFGGGDSLPQCTIGQMIDLDNNGVVNSKDAQVVLRWMVGKPVTVNGTKECNALNFLPIHG